ncbi:cilia- and flagella-associated protein 58 [Cyrtonyx montezumae]|uniref:cilia- and flagella-associated protein 58 n=1 Tax=Cyrtonyx montezumae TaxID=9017 RepID=UPI0032DA2236
MEEEVLHTIYCFFNVLKSKAKCSVPPLRNYLSDFIQEESAKLYLEESTLEALEKEFQEVISLLKEDNSLEKFRTEYEKLHAVLKKSHENEKRLMEKCRELNAELVMNSSKVAVLTKISKDDQETISSMKKEIEKAWKMVDVAYEKEQKAKETIRSLQEEVARLATSVDQGSGLSFSREYNISELVKYKEEITSERDQLLSEVVELRQSLTQATEQQQEAERAKNEADQAIMELQQEIQMCNNEVTREVRKKEKLEKELQNLQAEIANKQAEIKNLQQCIEKNKNEQLKMEQQLKEQKILNEKTAKELEQFQMKTNKLVQESEQHNVMYQEIVRDLQKKTAELQARDDELTQIHLDISKMNKVRDVLQSKLRAAEEKKVAAEHERETQKNQISGLQRELEAAKKQAEVDKKAIDDLVRERDTLSKNLKKTTDAVQKQIDLVKLHEHSKKKLEEEIENYKNEARKQRRIIYRLEKERDGYINEAIDLKQKVLQHMKDVEIREVKICDYEKKIGESEIKLKQQQNLCESVRTERNLFSKSLMEAKDEITEMKEKLKTMTHQVELLKEEIIKKEEALVKAQLEYQQLEKEKESLKDELLKMKKQALEAKQFIENQEAEERKLLQIIAEADAERLKQKKEYDRVIDERCVLGSQLVRRNDEVALLYEKIKIQQSILNKGETQYRERMEDIRLLKLEIRRLCCEKGILSKTVANVLELRQEVHRTRKELLKEQTRCKILEEELENPLNVHRWRKLKANDPSTFELIQKIQRLQKQLISKTGEVIEKELLLQEKEKLYVELKCVLARRPGPEAAEQLQLYRHTLREKTKQLKVLSSELNMCESQSQGYKSEIERLTNELLNVKKKYLTQKRKEQQAKEKKRSLAEMDSRFPYLRSDVPRFALSRPIPRVTA